MDHGCHKSASDHGEFLREEFADCIQNKFWTVLPYRLAKDFPNLQLSPAALMSCATTPTPTAPSNP